MAEIPTVETVQQRLSRLVLERQELRGRQASERTLERNRREITRYQQELSRALIQRYLHTPENAPA